MCQLKSWHAATAVSHQHHTLPLFESCYSSWLLGNDTALAKHCSEQKKISCITLFLELKTIFVSTVHFATFGLISHSEQGRSDENRSDKSAIRTFFVFGAISFGEKGIRR
jgi:hypothetical protein